ncbi:MAG: FMN-binding protein [Nocardioides sp.]
MKRITYWLLSTVSVLVLLFGYDASQRASTGIPLAAVSGGTAGTTSGGSATGGGNGNGNGNGNGGGNSGSSNSAGGNTPNGSRSQAATRTVTGSAVQTRWGPVQVRLAIKDGRISKVGILQYPNGNSMDLQIANYAFPVLIHETLQRQSAQIDMVSGATYTSTGYVQSLQSALDQANL